MINQIHSEWIKFRSVRSSLAMLCSAVLLGLGVASVSALIAKEDLDAVKVPTKVWAFWSRACLSAEVTE